VAPPSVRHWIAGRHPTGNALLTTPPIVLDADVLSRQVDYAVRRGYEPALFVHASPAYSTFTGVVLFATTRVYEEAVRRLPEIATRRAVPVQKVVGAWNELVVPRVRFVDMTDLTVGDVRVAEVEALDARDAPTAALACVLAPAILLTDNRKHFRPFAIPATKSDAVAVDLFEAGKLAQGVGGALVIPQLAGLGMVEGSKAVATKLGRDGAVVVGLLAVGALLVLLTSGRGRRFGTGIKRAASDAVPLIAQAMEAGTSAGRRITGFAIAPGDTGGAVGLVARRLALQTPTMATPEIASNLRSAGYSFTDEMCLEVATRRWLERTACFHEPRRGHWSLGFHVAPLKV
jgi:hypothetical protein